MKKIINTKLLAVVTLMLTAISCADYDRIDLPSSVGIAILGSQSTVVKPGETVSLDLSLVADQGIASLNANDGSATQSIDVTSGETVEYITYSYTVASSTTVGSEIEITFTITDQSGGSDQTTFTIETEEDPSTWGLAGSVTIGGEGAAEISAFDPSTNQLFVVNNDGGSVINVIDFQIQPALQVHLQLMCLVSVEELTVWPFLVET